MTSDDVDAPFEALRATLHEQQSNVSIALLREIYDVERLLQFERDRSRVMLAIRSAVEAEVLKEEAERSE